ncbi:CoA ester lyase [Azospirillum sp. INR13]|nr:CoA ester lyase [Azospirillum sp. INR13]
MIGPDKRSWGRHSWLFTPATKPDRFDRAAAAGADALIIDLEDAVAPADKAPAREGALAWLARPAPARGPLRTLRINSPASRHGLEDLLELLRSSALPDLLVIPKVESADVVVLVDRLLADAGKATPLVALIESARGVANAAPIAQSSPNLEALLFGAADYAADLGAELDWTSLLFARSSVVNAAALTGLTTIDSPFFAIDEEEGLRREATAAARLGFMAKAAIHPRQVSLINDLFRPSVEQLAQVTKILAENDKGVGVVDGRMIDEAVARKARRLLEASRFQASQDKRVPEDR